MSNETFYLCFVVFNFCLSISLIVIKKVEFSVDSIIDCGGPTFAFTITGPLFYMIGLALAPFYLPLALSLLIDHCTEGKSAFSRPVRDNPEVRQVSQSRNRRHKKMA